MTIRAFGPRGLLCVPLALAVAFAWTPRSDAATSRERAAAERGESRVFDEDAPETDPSEIPRPRPEPQRPDPRPTQPRTAPRPQDAKPAPVPKPKPTLPAARHNIPDADAVKAVVAELKEEFATEYGRRGARDRQALGRKLLGAAERASSSPVRLYALLQESAAASASGGDAAAALRAVDRLAESFKVERRTLALEALSAGAKAGKTPAAAAAFADAGLKLAEEFFNADDYAGAAKAAALAEGAARSVKDAALSARVKARAKQIREVESQYRKTEAAFNALKEDRDDPAANLKVGRFFCFVRGDWERGLPMLAKGSDTALQSLAEQEQHAPQEPYAKYELGNGWWERAKSESGDVADRCKQRAAKWYNDAEPAVDEGTRAEIRQRLESIRMGRVVDLTKLAVTSKDTVSGAWKKVKGDLASEQGSNARLQFPYQPPAEYDYRIEFTVVRGQTIINQVFPGPNGPLQFQLYTRSVSLSHAGGFGAAGATRQLDVPLWFGKRYSMQVKVRRDRVIGYINGDKAVEMDLRAVEGDNRGFNNGFGIRAGGLRDASALGLGSDYTQTIFHRVEVVELSGEGTLTR